MKSSLGVKQKSERHCIKTIEIHQKRIIMIINQFAQAYIY